MMSSRRDFLRRCALLAAGTVAADQLEILEKLSHSRVFTTGGYAPVHVPLIEAYPGRFGVQGPVDIPFGHVAFVRGGEVIAYADHIGGNNFKPLRDDDYIVYDDGHRA